MVIMLAKVDAVFFLLWAILYGFETIAISTEKNDFCKNDTCLSKTSQSYPEEEIILKPVKKIQPSIEEIYLLVTTEVPLEVSLDKSTSFQKFQESPIENPSDLEAAEKNNYSTENAELFFNITEVTDLNEFTTKDILNKTTERGIIKTISTSITKSNIPTTPSPFYSFASNSEKSKKNCFCDILTDHCDINCCCDEDCNLSHFKVFTKCYDEEYVTYDSKYCYSSNFIFENNTSYIIKKNSGGLFCIIRDNLKFGLNFKKKPHVKTLEDFNKALPNIAHGFSPKFPEKLKFMNEKYLAGSPVWTIQNNELMPLKILHSSVGLLCNSEVNIKYLVDEVKTCFYQYQPRLRCENSKIGNIIHYLEKAKIISNPTFLNKSQLFNSSEICKESMCIEISPYLCESIHKTSSCSTLLKNSNILQSDCWSVLSHIQYQIWHNGSEGITKVEAFLWVKKLPSLSDEFLTEMITEVEYNWIDSSKKIFRRSGNPGYLTGKPILAGRKIYSKANGTADKKEAIELSVDPKNWLSVLGSEKGICSSRERIPINFRENGQFMCSLELSKNNFSKEKCLELQINIFKLLIGNEIINESKENYFNKFVATFGNSKVEETGDWVQVLIDLFPISASPVSFKTNHNHLICKNVITDLYVDIIYSKIGSFLTPQSKILGVSFQFGKHKDLIFYCLTGCENTSLVQYFKLSTIIRFFDITEQAVDAFAEPLSLNTKLPHDFFYPFFSKSYSSQFLNKFVFLLFLFFVFF